MVMVGVPDRVLIGGDTFHDAQLVHHAAGDEVLQGAVDRHAPHQGLALLHKGVQFLGREMAMGAEGSLGDAHALGSQLVALLLQVGAKLGNFRIPRRGHGGLLGGDARIKASQNQKRFETLSQLLDSPDP